MKNKRLVETVKELFFKHYCDLRVTINDLREKRIAFEITKEMLFDWEDEYGIKKLKESIETTDDYIRSRGINFCSALIHLNKYESMKYLIDLFDSLDEKKILALIKASDSFERIDMSNKYFISDTNNNYATRDEFGPSEEGRRFKGFFARLYYNGYQDLYERFSSFLLNIIRKYAYYSLDTIISLISFSKEVDRNLFDKVVLTFSEYIATHHMSDYEEQEGRSFVPQLGFVEIIKVAETSLNFETIKSITDIKGINIDKYLLPNRDIDYPFLRLVLHHLVEVKLTNDELLSLFKAIRSHYENKEYKIIYRIFIYLERYKYQEDFFEVLKNSKEISFLDLFYDSTISNEWAKKNYFQTGKRYVGAFATILEIETRAFSFFFLHVFLEKYTYYCYDMALSLVNYYKDETYFKDIEFISNKYIDIFDHYKEVTNPYNYLEYLKPICDRGLEEEYNEILSNWDKKHKE